MIFPHVSHFFFQTVNWNHIYNYAFDVFMLLISQSHCSHWVLAWVLTLHQDLVWHVGVCRLVQLLGSSSPWLADDNVSRCARESVTYSMEQRAVVIRYSGGMPYKSGVLAPDWKLGVQGSLSTTVLYYYTSYGAQVITLAAFRIFIFAGFN